MFTRAFLATIPLAFLALLSAGQGTAPLLACSAPALVTRNTPRGPVSTWKVEITNRYRYPVTAYGIEFSYAGRPGGGKYDDSIPGNEGLRPPLPPGGSAAIFLPGKNPTPPTVVNTGVIYADGATGGDPAVIAHFLRVRAVFLAEMPSTIERLQAIAADPGADLSSVVAHFQQQEQEAETLIRSQETLPKLHVAPRVAGSIVANFRVPNVRIQDSAAAMARIFTKWKVQLDESQPKLPTVAFVTVPN